MTHRLARRHLRALSLSVATAIAMGALTTSASAAPAPIKIAGLFTEGASLGAPTTGSRTLKAFFKDYNARGGLKGRKIQVTTGNDSLNFEKSVAFTKQMIDEGVVAFVGNESYTDCLGNAGLYQQANVHIIGYGGAKACFALKQFGAVSQSVQSQIVLSVQYAKRQFGGKVCMIAFSVQGSDAIFDRAEQMLAKVGTKLAYKNVSLNPGGDPTAALLGARSAGCRSLVAQVDLGQGIQLVKAKQTQRIRNMDLILNQNHDYKTIRGAGSSAEGAYVFSYMYPFSENDSRTKAFRRFANKHNITPDNYSTPAYAMAQLFVNALENVKGSVTRQSVGAAIARLNVRNSLMPSGRFKFGGQGSGNAPNVNGYMLRISKGKFVKAPRSKLTLPSSVVSLAGV